MAGDTALTVWGLGHLAGVSVAVIVAGVDMGDYTVAADGSVTVPYGSDASGIVTPSYLATNFAASGSGVVGSDHDVTFTVYDGTSSTSVTVPILAGLTYTATGQLLRPVTTEALLADRGPALGKMRRGHKYAVLVEGVSQLKVGTSTDNLIAASMTSDGGLTPELANASDVPYTGVIVQPLADGPSYDTQLMWRVTRPYRCTLAMISVFAEGEK